MVKRARTPTPPTVPPAEYAWGVSEVPGEKHEDRIWHDGPLALLLDGHGGLGCVTHVGNAFRADLSVAPEERVFGVDPSTMSKRVRRLNRDFIDTCPVDDTSGCTLTCAHVHSDALGQPRSVSGIALGDSRLLLVHSDDTYEMLTPDDDVFSHRYALRARGGVVYSTANPKHWRVGVRSGRCPKRVTLNMARAMGNAWARDVLLDEPSQFHSPLRAGDLLVLATDGLWNVMSIDEVVAWLRKHRHVAKSAHLALLLNDHVASQPRSYVDDCTIAVFRS